MLLNPHPKAVLNQRRERPALDLGNAGRVLVNARIERDADVLFAHVV